MRALPSTGLGLAISTWTLAGCGGWSIGGVEFGGRKAPVAEAGFSRAVTVRETIVLDGSQSRSRSGRQLRFSWTLDSAPAGSQAALMHSETPTPSLIPDVLGSYLIRLVVHDGRASDPDTVTVVADTGADLRVGPGRPLETPGAAASVAKDGYVITIDAGVYAADAVVWRRDGLTIRGAGGLAHLEADGAHAQGKAIWVVQGDDTTIEGMEFSGATVDDGNGAGIRQEGAGLTLRHCYFHDNENGILASDNAASDLVIEHCEFARNGFGRGYTHNIYVNRVRSLTLRFNWFHHARVGHNVKTRAQTSYILYNRITDEDGGTASYAIDLSNGGLVYVIGNVIQQGPLTSNTNTLSFGPEGFRHAINELYLINNTLVSDHPSGTFVKAWPGGQVRMQNNIFAGRGRVIDGSASMTTNLVMEDPGFVSRAGYDYRLSLNSPARNAGSDPGTARGFPLTPTYQYRHRTDSERREIEGSIDIGAFEFAP